MFTILGKLLVLLIVALSVTAAALALGLYTNRINYPGSGQTQTPEAVQGELPLRVERTKALTAQLEQSRKNWNTSRQSLAAVEALRPQVQRWYADQLSLLRTGKDLNGQASAEPVRSLVYKNGRLLPDRNGSPTFEKLDLPPLEDLREQSKDAEEKILAQIAEVKKRIDEEGILSGRMKATRVLLEEEQRARKNSDDQLLNVLVPVLYDEDVKSRILEKRQRALEARLRELRNPVSVRQP